MDYIKDAHTFLKDHKLGVLSVSTPDGKPWGAAIYCVFAHDAFYFLTHTESEKYKLLRSNPNAAIVVTDDYKQITVQASGVVSEIELGDEHDEIMRFVAGVHPPGQFAWVPPVSKMHDGGTALIKLAPERIMYSKFNTQNGEPYVVDILK